jgi:hypothetical protein
MKTGRRLGVLFVVAILAVFALVAQRTYQYAQDEQMLRLNLVRHDAPEQSRRASPVGGSCPECGIRATVDVADFNGWWDGMDKKGRPIAGRFCRHTCPKCTSRLVAYIVHGDTKTNISWLLDKEIDQPNNLDAKRVTK